MLDAFGSVLFRSRSKTEFATYYPAKDHAI